MYYKNQPKACPVCKTKITESSNHRFKWQIKNFRSHIRKIAEREIFLKYLMNDGRKTPHFDYIKKNLIKVETTSFTVKI